MPGTLLRLFVGSLEGDEPPSEFRLLAVGANPYRKEGMAKPGSIQFDAEAAAVLMRMFSESGRDRMAIDYDHATSNPLIQVKKAAGWFVPQLRNGELWATDVKWTPRATKLLKNKELRFYSPTLELDEDKRALVLRPVALTNDPALCNLQPLMAASTTAQPSIGVPMKTLFKALGLAEDAGEAAALTAVQPLQDLRTQVLQLAGVSTPAEAIGVITALKQEAERAKKLSAELEQVKADKAKDEIAALLDAATLDGRIVPAERAKFEALGLQGLAACLSVLPKAKEPATPKKDDKQPTEVAQLSADELEIIKVTGITAEKFITRRAELRASKGA